VAAWKLMSRRLLPVSEKCEKNWTSNCEMRVFDPLITEGPSRAFVATRFGSCSSGGVLSEVDTATFHLQESELSEWRFVREVELDAYVTPVMARRLRASLASTDFVYLEEGTHGNESCYSC